MPPSSATLYDTIGKGYATQRVPDPRIAGQIFAAIRKAGSVANIGAGAGSYEPTDRFVDVAMAILTVHHWRDRQAGLRELARVARREVVILTWDPDGPDFWLTQRYFPAMVARDRLNFPTVREIARNLGRVRVEAVPVPGDCIDGFLGAYWRRPSSYLVPAVRASMSGFASLDGMSQGLERLREDLATGEWERQYGALLQRSHLDIGYRLVVASVQRVA